MPFGKVLVVDDAPAILEAVTFALGRLGTSAADIVTASTPEEALEAFRKAKPVVVLIDVDLNGRPGDEVALKLLRDSPRTKVIVMTGMDPGAQRVRAVVSAGAYAVLEKPIRFAKLREVIDLIEAEAKGLGRVS
jgi:CheY-like chemotaxis protein